MSGPQRAQARLVIVMIGIVVGCIGYALWLGSAQCIKVGGCG